MTTLPQEYLVIVHRYDANEDRNSQDLFGLHNCYPANPEWVKARAKYGARTYTHQNQPIGLFDAAGLDAKMVELGHGPGQIACIGWDKMDEATRNFMTYQVGPMEWHERIWTDTSLQDRIKIFVKKAN
jgi:hypothetical protein